MASPLWNSHRKPESNQNPLRRPLFKTFSLGCSDMSVSRSLPDVGRLKRRKVQGKFRTWVVVGIMVLHQCRFPGVFGNCTVSM